MSEQKSTDDFELQSIELPVKRTTGDDLEEILTSNAYHNVLPARYLQKDEDGNVIEEPDELFERVAKNVALADAVYQAEEAGYEIKATPDDIKPDASDNRRDDLALEVFGVKMDAVEELDTEPTVTVTDENLYAFAYDTIIPKLPDDVVEIVEDTVDEFYRKMTDLSFMPNSPTLMNAGDDFQQLSACFVDSPADDIDDIHETAKEAAKIFQCLTDDSTVIEQSKGIISVSEVESEDKILQNTDDGFEYKTVKETHVYENSPTMTVNLENGLEIQGTPNHELMVDGEWTRIDEVQESDSLYYSLGWIENTESSSPILKTVESGGQWSRKVSNEEIVDLYAEGLSDYEIADELGVGKSTVQRRRANELSLPPNGQGGRNQGSVSFDQEKVIELHNQNKSDSEIAEEVGVSSDAVRAFRTKKDLETNGTPVKRVTQPDQMTTRLAELVGFWAGDGSYHSDGVRFHVAREETVSWIEETVQSLFDTGVSKTYSDGCYSVTINSHEVKRFWKENFDVKSDGAKNVEVPSVITQGTPAEIKGYLRGYFSADGSISNDSYPVVYTSSEASADQIATLMMGLGIPSKKSTIRDSEQHPYYSVVPTTDYGRTIFSEEIGFIDSRSIDSVENPQDTSYSGGIWEVDVESVEESGEADVYDVTVEDNHEYITDGIISHNSGGGMGYAFTHLRPYGDRVGSTGGIASGPISFMRTFDQMCFPSGTEILTVDGREEIQNIEQGQYVVDENGDYQEVAETMSREINEEITEITFSRLNKTVKVTDEHPIMRVREGQKEWVDAGVIEEGDCVRVNARNETNELYRHKEIDLSEYMSGSLVDLDSEVMLSREKYGVKKGKDPETVNTDINVDEFFRLVGWYLAEGCVVHQRGVPSSVQFTLNYDEESAVSEIKNALRNLGVSVRTKENEERNTIHVISENATIAEMFKSWFGEGHKNKTVPRFIKEAPIESQVTVLTSLFEGDGHLNDRGAGSQRIFLGITAKEVVDFVYEVGIRSGAQFSRHRERLDEKSDVYEVNMSVSTALNTPISRIFNDIPDDFNPRDRSKSQNGYEIVEVKNVSRKEFNGKVYNINVKNTHSYIAEDVVFHNCGTIAQGGKRRGAQMGILRVDHPDIIQFLHAKDKDVSLTETLLLNDPDDFTHNSFGEALEEARELIETDEDGIERVPEHLRNAAEGHLSNFNISVGVTDDFMEAVKNDEEYTLINPRTDEPYIANEKTEELYGWFNLGDNVEVGEELSIPAREIWDRIAEGAWDNGEPGVIFLERANKMHTFDVEEHPEHEIHATNPCVTGDTNVLLANGESKQISELAREDENFQVEAIDNDGSITRSTAEAFKTKSNAETLEVSFANNTSVQMTPDHRIRTDSGWVEAQDIDDDARVRTPEGYTKVVSVKESEVADVYDLSVSDYHNYMVGEPSAWINVHNCGEQPLEEYEACNLGHINLSTLVSQDTPDWRAFEADGDLEDQVNEFLDQAIDWDELNSRIEIGTHFLENVVTMSDFSVDKITEKVSNNRKIGLGIMGLAQMYVQMGIEYGTDEADEVAKQVMEYINHRSKEVSHNIATGEDVYAERGVFDNWHKSKYADPTEYEEWFEYHTGLDAEEWEDGFPVRNHNTTTIAPTGTTSMIGNTTGGCEPIYQVAYYKNVSGDVQGDEMLVEFDDYFLRTLEANGINVDDVKREAQEQMSNNEFAGVDSLETVPDEIGELFVTTNQLSAKQHGSVQCALQKGVDSSISKTVNAPSTATVEDAKDTFMQIYEEGGKGVTYYRDGTRSKQVLTTREDNQETESAVDVVKEKFESGEIKLSDLGVESIDSETETTTAGSTPESRPKSLKGTTKELNTGYGDLYVTINETENDQPFEVFANIGKSGGYTESFTEATARLISLCLRCGIDPEDVIEQIEDIRSPKISWDRGEQVYSVPDGIAVAMRRHIEDDETGMDAGAPTNNSDTESNNVIDAGENPECPSCGGLSLYYSEGCKTCEECGWSEC